MTTFKLAGIEYLAVYLADREPRFYRNNQPITREAYCLAFQAKHR